MLWVTSEDAEEGNLAEGTGNKGLLGIVVDIAVAIMIFALPYIWFNNYLSNEGGTFALNNPDPVGVFNRIIWPWHSIPIGFLFAIVLRSIYGREWKMNMRSMLVWSLITVSLFVFYIVYLAYDYYVVTFLPSLIPISVTQAVDAVAMIVTLWQDVLPWGVTLCVLIYGIISQDETPEATIYSG